MLKWLLYVIYIIFTISKNKNIVCKKKNSNKTDNFRISLTKNEDLKKPEICWKFKLWLNFSSILAARDRTFKKSKFLSKIK